MQVETAFAPAERADSLTLQQQQDCVNRATHVSALLDALPSFAAVLNSHRQIVYANRALGRLLETFQASYCTNGGDSFIGKRPGEALNCVHSLNYSGGCGTTIACQTCGAILAILQSQAGTASTQECRMLRKETDGHVGALDLRVSAHPLQIESHQFTLVTMDDISGEKRRQALERIFFHDVLNTASGLQGLAKLLSDLELQDKETRNIAGLLSYSADALVDEIQAQRTLTSAERSDLVPLPESVELLPFLHNLALGFAEHEVARERHIHIKPEAQPATIQTDASLLRRVVLNILKNALEASKRGETVSIDTRASCDFAEIHVHNHCAMTEDVKNQVFNRSFSTRGLGRGLGTYSVKLLTERYLGGTVRFQSKPGLGTLFIVSFPLKWQSKPATS